MHALADVGLVQQVHRPLFQHAGTDTPLDVVPALAFDDDAVDALQRQQPRQQQPGRTGPDDAYLCLMDHNVCPVGLSGQFGLFGQRGKPVVSRRW